MLGLSVAAADGGFLGLSADQYGLYHTLSPALDSLHADYHFFHHHEMAAGTQLALDGVSSFGSSAHVRVQPLLKTGAADGALSLSLCNGATVFRLSVALPPPRDCKAQPYPLRTGPTHIYVHSTYIIMRCTRLVPEQLQHGGL